MTEAGNASRTLLYDIVELSPGPPRCSSSSVCRPPCCPRSCAPTATSAAATRCPVIADGTPIAAVLADSHAALFGHGCTEVGRPRPRTAPARR